MCNFSFNALTAADDAQVSPSLECALQLTSDLQAELILIGRRHNLEANWHATKTIAHGNVRCRETKNIEDKHVINASYIHQ